MKQQLGEHSPFEVWTGEDASGDASTEAQACIIWDDMRLAIALSEEETSVLARTLLAQVPDVQKNMLLRFAHFVDGFGYVLAEPSYGDTYGVVATGRTLEDMIRLSMEYDGQMEQE